MNLGAEKREHSQSISSARFLVATSEARVDRDVGSASGPGVTGATGSSNSSTTYHLTYHGQRENGVSTLVDVSFSESGTYFSRLDQNFTSESFKTQSDTTLSGSYGVSYTAVQSDGSWNLISFSGYDNTNFTQNSTYDDAIGTHIESHYDVGNSISNGLAGSNLVSYIGTSWNNSHGSTFVPDDPNGAPGTYNTWENNDTNTHNETSAYQPDVPDIGSGFWHAEELTAENFTWHGVSTTGGKLAQTVSLSKGSVDVSSFSISGSEQDYAHLIEDEPGAYVSGGESELYHKNEVYEGGSAWLGSGSRMNGVYVGNYHVDNKASFSAHNILDTTNAQSSGYDEDGNAFNQTFNFHNDRTSGGKYQSGYDIAENNSGALVSGSTFQASDGSGLSSRYWGTYNGASFDVSKSGSESSSGTATLPASTVRANWTLPRVEGPLGGPESGPQYIQYVPPTTPPTIPFVPHPLGGLRTGATGLQNWYNRKISAIGEDAKKKVGTEIGKVWIINEMNLLAGTNGGHRYTTGTFTHVAKGQTFAQAVGMGEALDKEIGIVSAGFPSIRVKTVTVDVEIKYYVEPPAVPGQNRSGKVVIEYKFIIRVTGTSKITNAVVTAIGSTSVRGSNWFVSEGLKTADLVDQP